MKYDLLVIGGGINGTGIAADAAGRGLKVLLCEKGDLAGSTSSASSKLIHGGLRYLEYYEFLLVRKALKEREILLAAAPHLIKPLPFHIPHLPHLRPRWMIRCGLFLYDFLARRIRVPGSRSIQFDQDSPLKDELKHGFEYWDAQVDDARLVVANAYRAREKGATVLSYTECMALSCQTNGWQFDLKNHRDDSFSQHQASVVINASGPWVSSFVNTVASQSSAERASSQQPRLQAKAQVRLVKGSHIVVNKLHLNNQAYLLQNEDNRVVFVIPYLQDYSLIGTTEAEFSGDPSEVSISAQETQYLLAIVNRFFKKQLSSQDIVHSFSGVRPLVEDEDVATGENTNAGKVSRDYRLEWEDSASPLLSIYGGKVTTYRILAEQAVDSLKSYFPKMSGPWTEATALPGGEFQNESQLLQQLTQHYPWMDKEIIERYSHSYGSLSAEVLAKANSVVDLGRNFGHGLFQLEVDYLCDREWACSTDDILWRRSKLGLCFTQTQVDELQQYLQSRPS